MKDKPVILIVDDYPPNNELLEAYLVPQGYEIVKAANGEEALGKLSDNQIDMILLDVQMPGIDGFEVTRRVRQDDTHRLLPIILVTALHEKEDRVKGIDAGCDDFISKPVDKMELLARVRSLLKVKAYNDLISNYQKELEAEVSRRTWELKRTLETLQQHITERKRVEETLRESEKKYRLHFENVTDVIFSIDQELRLLDITPSVENVLGYRPDELTGKPIGELNILAVDHLEEVYSGIRYVLAGNRISAKVYEFIAKDGTRKFCEVGVAPLLHDGRVAAVICAARDITERKQAEEWLLRERSMVDRIMKTSPAGIIVVNRDGQIIFANKRAEEIYGRAADGMTRLAYNSPEWLITDFDGNPFPIEKLPHAMVISSGSPVYGIRHAIHSPDGRRVYLSINGAPIHDENGNSNEVVFTINDVSERKQAEASLQATNEEIKTISQQLWQAEKLATMGELASSIAHELNNPLATVSLRVESLIAQSTGDDPRRRELEIIEKEIERMGNLVSNLLQFSRRSQPQISTVNVCDEIEKTLELVHYHLRKHNIAVAREFKPEGPLIHADRQQLRQLFLNLFTNASDAMPEGGTLTIRVTERLEEKQICIEIADTGVGIPPEILPKVLEPFYTTKPEGKGTGLGLAICRRIANNHSGQLEIMSDGGPGNGTRVCITLPFSNGSNSASLRDE